MNVKRIAALAALSAMISTVAPAMAASNTGQVNVDWNTQAPTTIVLHTQTSASLTHTGPENIYWVGNAGGVSGCNGVIAPASGTAGTDTSADGTVNFGAVTPEVGAFYTGCLEPNALEAYIASGDSKGVTLKYTLSGTPAGSYGAATGVDLCLITEGQAYANTMAYTASARTAAIAPTSTANACPSGGGASVSTPLSTVANSTLFTGTAAPSPAMDINWDMELELSQNAPTAGSPVTATLAFTAFPN